MYIKNEVDLVALGQRIGQHLQPQDVLVLTGDLGAGKTTLTKGIALGLGIHQMIKSPTYTIVRAYEGRCPLYHLDVYRIGGDADSIDLDEFLFGDGVTVIEWGNLLTSNLPESYMEVILEVDGEGRQVTLQSHGANIQKWFEDIENDGA